MDMLCLIKAICLLTESAVRKLQWSVVRTRENAASQRESQRYTYLGARLTEQLQYRITRLTYWGLDVPRSFPLWLRLLPALFLLWLCVEHYSGRLNKCCWCMCCAILVPYYTCEHANSR
jgi:hypothetical protein